jgi:glycosyltransferase involved in cell wall biosynthesis
VPNPIDPAEVLGSGDPSEDVVRVGVLGGSSYRKGFDMLPEVIERLSSRPVTWRLHVSSKVVEAGMEEAWQAIRAHDPSTVNNVGKVVDVSEAYAQLDIVFCPSRQESFCRVAAEAMLNGIPVVGSDIPPLRDLLGEDEAGILFPVGDVGAAADALGRLVDDAELRASLGKSGQERARRFEPEQVASELLELYGIS